MSSPQTHNYLYAEDHRCQGDVAHPNEEAEAAYEDECCTRPDQEGFPFVLFSLWSRL